MDIRTQAALLAAIVTLALAVAALLRDNRPRAFTLFALFSADLFLFSLSIFFLRWTGAFGGGWWERLAVAAGGLLPASALAFFLEFLGVARRPARRARNAMLAGSLGGLVGRRDPLVHSKPGQAPAWPAYVAVGLAASSRSCGRRCAARPRASTGPASRTCSWARWSRWASRLLDMLPRFGVPLPARGAGLDRAHPLHVLPVADAAAAPAARPPRVPRQDRGGHRARAGARERSTAASSPGWATGPSSSSSTPGGVVRDPLPLRAAARARSRSGWWRRSSPSGTSWCAELEPLRERDGERHRAGRPGPDGARRPGRDPPGDPRLPLAARRGPPGYRLLAYRGPPPVPFLEPGTVRALLSRLGDRPEGHPAREPRPARRGAPRPAASGPGRSGRPERPGRARRRGRGAEAALRRARGDGGHARRHLPCRSWPATGWWASSPAGTSGSRRPSPPTRSRRCSSVADRCALVIENSKLYQQMKERDRLAALGEMAAGLAHEIRNPLAAIKGATQYLDPRSSPTRTGEFLEIIVEEVDRLNGVVTPVPRLLPAARAPRMAPTDVNDVLSPHLQAPPGRGASDRGGRRWSLPTASRGSWRDAEQLKQVFLNLALNAFQAMPKGGKLTRLHLRSPGTTWPSGGRAAAAPTWSRSASATPGRASPRRPASTSSSPSTPPRRRAPAWASPSASASSRRTRARSPSTPLPARGPSSSSPCPGCARSGPPRPPAPSTPASARGRGSGGAPRPRPASASAAPAAGPDADRGSPKAC